MKKKLLTWAIAVTAIVVLLVLTSVTEVPVNPPTVSDQNTKINLALREIADQLLQQNQDFKSLIPPIKREGEGSYLITLGTEVDYSSLRSIVDAVLDRHAIRPDYRLSLLNCDNCEVELGFLARAGDDHKNVACQEREQTSDCYNLRLAFLSSEEQLAEQPLSTAKQPFRWLLLGLALSFPMAWLALQQQSTSPAENKAMEADGWIIKSKNTAFHPTNQTLKIKDQAVDLTFREAKLLQFFFEHPNLVLERERILEAVWEDEGIIVGRSLDVFVSRLRKKLKPDADIQIVNVHGVGYRLMI